MNKKQYMEKRNKMLSEADALLNDGKVEEANAIMNDVKKLDEDFEKQAQARADLEALNGTQKPLMVPGFFDDGKADMGKGLENLTAEEKFMKAWESEDYKTAWAKTLQGKNLSAEEQKTYAFVNEAYTHTTGNTSVVIPKSVATGIWEQAAELYPYFGDVTVTHLKGTFGLIQEDGSSDAAWYSEGTATEDGKETFKELILSGCELARDIKVSWKLKAMAIEDFIPYIERKMAYKMGAGADYGVLKGKGKTDESKPEPVGVITAILAEEGTPQVIEYEKGKLSFTNITAARGLIKSAYNMGLKLYANNHTVWNEIANVLDANKRPIFMADPTTGGYKVLGLEVKEDDTLEDGEILFSNPERGYHANINDDIKMLREEHNTERLTVYTGYAVMDGNTTTTKAHALLKRTAV